MFIIYLFSDINIDILIYKFGHRKVFYLDKAKVIFYTE